VLAFGKMLATSLSIGIGGSGGIFAPSLFIGVTSGYIVNHLFGASAGQPALYAVVAMGAVFTSAARAPLTSLASVVEISGDFSLTLPVMLAVAIASMTSRAMSYGTIYTTKLLRSTRLPRRPATSSSRSPFRDGGRVGAEPDGERQAMLRDEGPFRGRGGADAGQRPSCPRASRTCADSVRVV
jgi:hypothetical protein